MPDSDDFQRRAGEEGRVVQGIARKVLTGCGFINLRPNERLREIGVTVNVIGEDANGREWYFDVSGAFTSPRAGLIRTDTMWKTLGRANVLHQSGVERLILLTTNLPKQGSGGHKALVAAAETFFDAIEMLTPDGKARLRLYAERSVDRPLPGLRSVAQLYTEVFSRTIGAEVELSVPIIEVASALPARITFDVVVMPHRLKVLFPSKDASGTEIAPSTRRDAGERIRALLESFAGGCTLTPGVGSWLDPIGGEMFEDVTLIESYSDRAFPESLLMEVVQMLLRDLGQHTAALILNDRMVHVTPR